MRPPIIFLYVRRHWRARGTMPARQPAAFTLITFGSSRFLARVTVDATS